MRSILLCLFLLPFILNGQQTITESFTHNGLVREYILYVPETYSPGQPAPLVLNFHGYTSNAVEQMFYGDFRPIADTAGFLIVHPLGTRDLLNNPHWNVGWGTSSVDDVVFTSALIDRIAAEWAINQNRIYSTGMSNGGFMSYRLACELSGRIAAIASVTGTMTAGTTATCAPTRPVPVMEIHGTADATVAYTGGILFTPISGVLTFWANRNNCESSPIITLIDDHDPTDGSTVEHHLYPNGTAGSVVEHFKINNGAHTWPGSAFGGGGTNRDINASAEIWRFFSQYDLDGLIQTTSSQDITERVSIRYYPQPAGSFLTIEMMDDGPTAYMIYDLIGKPLLSGRLVSERQDIDLSRLASGMYVLKVGSQSFRLVRG